MQSAIFDASVVVKLYVEDELTPAADWCLETYEPSGPDILLYETSNAFWKYVTAGRLDPDVAQQAISDVIKTFDLQPAIDYVSPALKLATAHGHPVYDMLYVAMAQELRMPLLTADKRLMRKLEQNQIDSDVVDITRWTPS